MSIRAWEKTINEIERESNACRLKDLARKLNDAMLDQEREKVTQPAPLFREGASEPSLTLPWRVHEMVRRRIA